MLDLSLHILDIVENSITAGANGIRILVQEDLVNDRLLIAIADNGEGMNRQFVSEITDPFTTTRTCRKVGLGIPLLKTRAEQCHGSLSIDSRPGKGTTTKVIFQYGHIDRPPLGDITSTLICIILANPGLDVIYEHYVGDVSYQLDTRRMEKIVGECYSGKGSVLALVSEDIKKGLLRLKKERERVFKQVFGYLPRVNLI